MPLTALERTEYLDGLVTQTEVIMGQPTLALAAEVYLLVLASHDAALQKA